MTKLIDELTQLLCTVDEIEKNIEIQEPLYICNRDWKAWDFGTMTEDDFEEIEKEISLKHLQMYCEEKGVEFTGKGFIKYFTEGFDNGVYIGRYEFTDMKYDITKDHLYEQTDEVITSIINFLKGV